LHLVYELFSSCIYSSVAERLIEHCIVYSSTLFVADTRSVGLNKEGQKSPNSTQVSYYLGLQFTDHAWCQTNTLLAPELRSFEYQEAEAPVSLRLYYCTSFLLAFLEICFIEKITFLKRSAFRFNLPHTAFIIILCSYKRRPTKYFYVHPYVNSQSYDLANMKAFVIVIVVRKLVDSLHLQGNFSVANAKCES
jgi:hypothetical protein